MGFRKSISTVKTIRKDFIGDTIANLAQTNGPVGKGVFAFGRLGVDYLIDNRNTLSLSGSMARGQFKNHDDISIVRDTNYVSFIRSDFGNRSSNSNNNFRNYGSCMKIIISVVINLIMCLESTPIFLVPTGMMMNLEWAVIQTMMTNLEKKYGYGVYRSRG